MYVRKSNVNIVVGICKDRNLPVAIRMETLENITLTHRNNIVECSE